MMKKPYGIWKIILWCIISVYTGAMCLLLSSCGRKENDSIYGQDLYAGEVQEADVFIDIPNLRQYGSYTCGATCVQMLMNWLEPYQKDMNLVTYEELLETSEEAGTPPENIIKYFEENGVKIIAQEKRTIDDLVTSLKQGHPMLMCIQAWSAEEDGYNTQNPDNAETYLAEGHWVICVGYQNQENGRVFYFNDPACVGYCVMNEEDLEIRWIDMDAGGKIYDHYGIEIDEDNNDYHPGGAFYLE